MATFVPRASDVRGNWYVLDADNQVLGRLATRAAMLLMGKHKPDYTPFLKTGDHVIIINAEKVRLTGSKDSQSGRFPAEYSRTSPSGSLNASCGTT